jgi:hypothetical protein
MNPIIRFSDAYERAGLSCRKGEFTLGTNPNWVGFEFNKKGWIRPKIEFLTSSGIVIDQNGVIKNLLGEKIGEITLSRKFFSYWILKCELDEFCFDLLGINIKRSGKNRSSSGGLEIRIYSNIGIFYAEGYNTDPFLFPFNLGEKRLEQAENMGKSELVLCVLIFYLSLMGSNNC